MNPKDLLDRHGAEWSPNVDAYAEGRINAPDIACVLCHPAPCQCRPIDADHDTWAESDH